MSADAIGAKPNRELIFDFLRSILMLFVFLHHFYLSFPNNIDYIAHLNPFAELFVGLAGFMVGLVYLYRNKDVYLIKRGVKILLAFYIVALPEAAIKAYAEDSSSGHVLHTIGNVFLMLEDPTTINILRFYGVIFILLPIILFFYRRAPIPTLIFSVCTFLTSTLLYYSSPDTPGFFVSQTLMLLLQWQMFFIIGLRIGDLYKTKKLNLSKLIKVLVIAGPLALLVQWLWFQQDIAKFPYSFGKMFGIVYLAPIVVFSVSYLYAKVKGSRADSFIRVVGRNSLSAFVLSECIRILLIKVPVSMFSIRYSGWSSLGYAIFLSLVLICIMWGYERFKKFRKAFIAKTFGVPASEKKQLSVN
jgi:hypothetical protein